MYIPLRSYINLKETRIWYPHLVKCFKNYGHIFYWPLSGDVYTHIKLIINYTHLICALNVLAKTVTPNVHVSCYTLEFSVGRNAHARKSVLLATCRSSNDRQVRGLVARQRTAFVANVSP